MQSDVRSARLELRAMCAEDLEQVAAVERDSYVEGWPATAFTHELERNRLARYVVLDREGEILGFAGLWLLVDQAHVVTVAVKPAERRHGYGRLLVHVLIEVALAAGMDSATLECRVSNEAARALYRQYGFYDVGERKRYYADNGEDAVIMTTEALASPAYRARLARLESELPRPLDEAGWAESAIVDAGGERTASLDAAPSLSGA